MNLNLKRIVIAACIAIAIGFVSLVTTCTSKTSVEKEIRVVFDDYHASLLSHDPVLLERVLSDQVELVTPIETTVLNRGDFVRRVDDVDGQLQSVESTDVTIITDGERGWIKCLERMTLYSNESNVITHEGYYLYEFTNDEMGWRIVSVHQQ
jgi:hypothetical protein